MKLARRLLSVLLALLMVFALVACGGTGDTPSDDPGKDPGKNPGTSTGNNDVNIKPTDEFEPPERPVDETAGKNYIIIQHSEIENPFGYSQDSNMGLQVSDRVNEVCETYGCTIEFSMSAYDTNFASRLQAAMFAENSGDMVFAYKNAMLRKALGTGGSTSLMQDLLQVDHIINFWDANKWGTLTARESMMAGGTFYGVSPALWVDCTPLPYYQVVYNKDIIELTGVTDPQEYWENEEWDREAMLDVITETTDEASGIWGMTASMEHMVMATFLTAGKPFVVLEKVNSDGTAEWSRGLEDGDVLDALQWLKNALNANTKCFNNGTGTWTTWDAHTPFNEGLCAMAVTRPIDVFGYVVVEGPSNFGIATWAGDEANTLTGFYEQVYSVAIPLFAQNIEHSAFLMYDLFEGLGDIQTYDDVLAYYGDTYFNTELDLTCMVREGAVLQYSYWPNEATTAISNISSNLLTAGSITTLVGKYAPANDAAVEEHILPNQVALYGWQQAGYFD